MQHHSKPQHQASGADPVGLMVACRSLRRAIMWRLSPGAAPSIQRVRSCSASGANTSPLYSWLRPTHSRKDPSDAPSKLPQPCDRTLSQG